MSTPLQIARTTIAQDNLSAILDWTNSSMLNTYTLSRPSPSQSSHTYQHLLSRIPPGLGTILNPPPRPVNDDYGDAMSRLLVQPPEIRNLIFAYLDTHDWLSLRATNHLLHNIVHSSEKASRLRLADHISRSNNLLQIPIRIPDLSDFLRTSIQYDACCRLAKALADHVSRHLAKFAEGDDKVVADAWRKKKRGILVPRLTRSLIALQQYLNFLLDTLNQNEKFLEPLDDREYSGLDDIFDLDQQAWLKDCFAGMTEKDYLDFTATAAIIRGTCKVKGVPLDRRSHEHSVISVRQILIYKGFSPIAELLAPGAGKYNQEIVLKRVCRQITKERRSDYKTRAQTPLPTIHALKGYHRYCDLFFDQYRINKTRNQFISRQDIWDRSARAVMMAKLGRCPKVQSASTWIKKVVATEEKESEFMVGPWDMVENS